MLPSATLYGLRYLRVQETICSWQPSAGRWIKLRSYQCGPLTTIPLLPSTAAAAGRAKPSASCWTASSPPSPFALESQSCTTTETSTYWPGTRNYRPTALKADAGKVAAYPRRRAHESRSATVRLNTGAPGAESRSTQKYPCRRNWNRSPGCASASDGSTLAVNVLSESGLRLSVKSPPSGRSLGSSFRNRWS